MTLFIQLGMLLFGLGVVFFSILFLTRIIRGGSVPTDSDIWAMLPVPIILGVVFIPQVVLALRSKDVEMTFDGLIISNTLLHQRASRVEVPFGDILSVTQPLYLRMANDCVLVRFRTPNAHGSSNTTSSANSIARLRGTLENTLQIRNRNRQMLGRRLNIVLIYSPDSNKRRLIQNEYLDEKTS